MRVDYLLIIIGIIIFIGLFIFLFTSKYTKSGRLTILNRELRYQKKLLEEKERALKDLEDLSNGIDDVE